MTAQENSKKKKGNKVDQEAVDSTAQVKNLLTKVSANFQQKLFTIDAAKIPGNRYGSRKNLFARDRALFLELRCQNLVKQRSVENSKNAGENSEAQKLDKKC